MNGRASNSNSVRSLDEIIKSSEEVDRDCKILFEWNESQSNKQKWCLGTDWDWLIAPTFVDCNHFIVIAESFTLKKILCCDSMKGISRKGCLKLMQEWICSLKIEASEANGWSIQECSCPQQDNDHDCGIFAFLASAYLPCCDVEGDKMSEYYIQQQATAVRKLLADSIYQHGESMNVHKLNLFKQAVC